MNKSVLAITQCFPCGSWVCIEKILEGLSKDKFNIHILGLGAPNSRSVSFKYHLIQYLAFTKYGNITCYSPILALLWMTPLYISSILFTFIKRINIVMYNGFALGLILSPLFKLFGKTNIIMFHSEIGNVNPLTRRILSFLLHFVDLIIVNSTGMYSDIITLVKKSKVIVNEHYADKIFFDVLKKKIQTHATLRVLYAGRIDSDKRCFPLIDFAKKMKDDGRFEFTFVGAGFDVDKVRNLNSSYPHIKYCGYISDKYKLAELYRSADIVWSFADTTYLGLPAIEALACDTPIIVPKYAAIANKNELIDRSLVPPTVGWLVDPYNSQAIETLMSTIHAKQLYKNMQCRKYAAVRYSSKNLVATITCIKKIISSKP